MQLALGKQLTIDEIKTIVIKRKWMAEMGKRISTRMDDISHHLTQRIKELAGRCETRPPNLEDKTSRLERKVKTHLANMGFRG